MTRVPVRTTALLLPLLVIAPSTLPAQGRPDALPRWSVGAGAGLQVGFGTGAFLATPGAAVALLSRTAELRISFTDPADLTDGYSCSSDDHPWGPQVEAAALFHPRFSASRGTAYIGAGLGTADRTARVSVIGGVAEPFGAGPVGLRLEMRYSQEVRGRGYPGYGGATLREDITRQVTFGASLWWVRGLR